MRGRSCTQPFLVEGGDLSPRCLPSPALLGESIAPHPPQCALGAPYGLWWLRLDDRTVPGLFDPRGKALGREEPSVADFRPSQGPEQNQSVFARTRAGQNSTHPEVPTSLARFGASQFLGAQRSGSPNSCPPPSPPSWWAAVTGVRYRAAGQAEKREDPRRVLQPEQESRGRNSPLWPSFPPFLGRNGGPRRVGALRGAAPRGLVRAPTTRRVRSTAPQKISLQTSIFNSIIKSR